MIKGTYRVTHSFSGPAGSAVDGEIVTDPPDYYGPFIEPFEEEEADDSAEEKRSSKSATARKKANQ